VIVLHSLLKGSSLGAHRDGASRNEAWGTATPLWTKIFLIWTTLAAPLLGCGPHRGRYRRETTGARPIDRRLRYGDSAVYVVMSGAACCLVGSESRIAALDRRSRQEKKQESISSRVPLLSSDTQSWAALLRERKKPETNDHKSQETAKSPGQASSRGIHWSALELST